MWYDELHEAQLSWPVFSHSLKKQFPGELSFGILFREQFSRKILIGRDVLATPRVKAVVDAAGLKLEKENESVEPIEVNFIKNDRRDIDEEDIHSLEVDDPKIIRELVSLLNKYQTTIALNMRELGEAKSTKLKLRLINDEPVSYRPSSGLLKS